MFKIYLNILKKNISRLKSSRMLPIHYMWPMKIALPQVY